MSCLPPWLVLRPLRSSDARAAATLHAGAAPPGWPAADWASLLGDPVVFGAAAEADGRIVGAALARAAAGEGELLMVVIHPGFRRRGIATALVNAVLDEAGRRGAEMVFLEVAAANSSALALYRRLGFVDAGRRPGYYGPGEAGDAVILACRPRLDASPGGS